MKVDLRIPYIKKNKFTSFYIIAPLLAVSSFKLFTLHSYTYLWIYGIILEYINY